MFLFLRRRAKSKSAPCKRANVDLSYEQLEVRDVLSTFSVVNLNAAGAGSFRQALTDANSAPGADTISFNVAGTISLASSLPTVTDEVDIDGTTAPGFASSPVVALDFNNTQGLRFKSGA